MAGTTEPPGDPIRNAAALVESFLNDQPGNRFALMVPTMSDHHTADHCPLRPIVIFLADEFASLARETGTDLGPRLAQWRALAEVLDAGE